MADKQNKPEDGSVETTGHQWDDEEGYPLQEFNNPLPRWWINTFYATIAYAVIYWFLYPAWPMLESHTKGLLGWDMHTQLAEEMAEAKALQKPFDDQLAATPIEEIAKDPKLLAYAMSGGKAIFGDNCAPCHGSGGSGAKGFPNLTDDDWLYGGDLTVIQETIDGGRTAMMPAHLESAGGAFSEAQVKDLVAYVLTLSGVGAAGEGADRGKALFHGDASCNACHGDHGKGAASDTFGGDPLYYGVGAPNLTDGIWLYGGSPEAIYETIAKGRAGKMPAWGTGFAGFGKQLDPLSVKQVTLFVHSLGGGK